VLDGRLAGNTTHGPRQRAPKRFCKLMTLITNTEPIDINSIGRLKYTLNLIEKPILGTIHKLAMNWEEK